jgi:hypothetical protein
MMTDETTPKRRRGCLFYGCIMGLLLLCVVLVAGLAGWRFAKKMLSDFTDTKPMVLPKVQLPPAEFDALQRKVETFRDAVRLGQETNSLALTATEINALINSDPDLQDLKGKLFVSFEGEQLQGQVSVPMDQVGLPAFRGRFLNGTGMFELSFRNGFLRIAPQSFVIRGKPIPELYMEKIRKQNLAGNINHDARAQVAMDKLQDIRIRDSKLVIVPKGKP